MDPLVVRLLVGLVGRADGPLRWVKYLRRPQTFLALDGGDSPKGGDDLWTYITHKVVPLFGSNFHAVSAGWQICTELVGYLLRPNSGGERKTRHAGRRLFPGR